MGFEKMNLYNGNKVAIETVKNHLIVKIDELKSAEEQAILDGKIQSEIENYHDQSMLYAGFLAQL